MINEIVAAFAAILDNDFKIECRILSDSVPSLSSDNTPNIKIYSNEGQSILDIKIHRYLMTLWFHRDCVTYWYGHDMTMIKYEDIDISKIVQHLKHL